MQGNLFQKIGPGALVAAAFIGPGTVTTATLAGAKFGYTLLWALVFATFATIILQEMAARAGVVTGKGLGSALADVLNQSVWKWPVFAVVGTALYLGNAAYEAGNLSGAALGVAVLLGDDPALFKGIVVVISILAGWCLWQGSYRFIERALIGLVGVMTLAFFATFLIVQPDWGAFARGLFVPSIPANSLTVIVALIGTTVVPYNLFLHASAVRERYKTGCEDLSAARTDTVVSVAAGGLITVIIVATAAASLFVQGLSVSGAGDMARQFEPLFGPLSKTLLGVGFFAAGLSSAMTAPFATGYAVTEILQLEGARRRKVSRWVMLSVIASGAAFAVSGIKPVTIILSAQFANGLLLPGVVVFLLFLLNQKRLLGDHRNRLPSNLAGGLVALVSLLLGARLVLKALGLV